jgi:ribonuclease Z
VVFELTILGSSSALPTSKRYPSAHVLNAHERFFLIDCGEGTQMQLRRNRIRIGKIHNIFISHMHGDHVFGLYGFLSTQNLTGRKTPLNLYAPEAFEVILHNHLSDFDINLNFNINFIPLAGKDPKKIYDDKAVVVHSFPLKHRVPTFGFLFREKDKDRNIIKECIAEYKISVAGIQRIKKGEDFITSEGKVIPNNELTTDPPPARSFAYCCDTAYFKRLSNFISGVDLLYHESTFASDKKDLAKKTGHSTAAQAATVARDAGVSKLVIGHFSARYRETNELLKEAREIFPETIAAMDNTTIGI